MKKNLLIALLLSFFGLSVNGQDIKVSPDESKKLGGASKSQPFILECLGETNQVSADLSWRPILTNVCVAREPKVPDHELIEKMKEDKLLLKQQQSQSNRIGSESSAQSVTPIVGSNWLGNVNNGGSPLDNSIAISNGGIIVSVANTTLEIDNTSGTLLFYNDLPTFFNDPTITNTCDPVVLYDRIADRFILFFQECAGNSSNSYLCICFSKTNNPATGGWWKYKLTGNPLNNSCWFDYPKMAVSNNELYIAGNLFTNGGTFDQAILYQIEKAAGYSGGSINWQYWYNISGSPFTLMPVGSGQGLSYTPGCYLVATVAGGSSTIKLYDLTDDMSGAPSLNYYSVSTTAYSPAADASQSGTACLLDNGDCRVLSGFYLNGIIHFAFHSDIGSGWNGINYNRLTVSSTTNVSSTFGLTGSYDYSYPSISSYATTATDKSVMIGFGRTSSSIFPEVRVVNCDNSMTWGGSTLVKSSSSYVSYTSSTNERWGDYTGTARKHNSSSPSIWMNGMYGTSSNLWNTWIAEIHDNGTTGLEENKNDNSIKVYPNPIVETFFVDFTLAANTTLFINVVDINGRTVKELYNGKAFAGNNSFSFNKANLSSGTYFLIIKNEKTTFKNEKIIIAN